MSVMEPISSGLSEFGVQCAHIERHTSKNIQIPVAITAPRMHRIIRTSICASIKQKKVLTNKKNPHNGGTSIVDSGFFWIKYSPPR